MGFQQICALLSPKLKLVHGSWVYIQRHLPWGEHADLVHDGSDYTGMCLFQPALLKPVVGKCGYGHVQESRLGSKAKNNQVL